MSSGTFRGPVAQIRFSTESGDLIRVATPPDGDDESTWSGGVTPDGLHVYLRCSHQGLAASPNGSAVLTKIAMSGTGTPRKDGEDC